MVWVGDWPQDPGDDTILDHAYQDKRILVTQDKDFGELAIAFNRPHHGIVRLMNLSARDQDSICLEVLNRYGDELVRGSIVTAETRRIRIRPRLSER